MTTRMFLRVKRPRSAAPASTIRLEGLDGFVKPSTAGSENSSNTNDPLSKQTIQQQEGDFDNGGTGAAEPAVKRSCAVWKRIDTDKEMFHTTTNAATTEEATTAAMRSERWISKGEEEGGIHNKRSRPVYFVADAILEGAYNDGRSSKRRKLTIVESSHHEEFPLSLVPPSATGKPGASNKHNNKKSNRIRSYPVLDPLTRLVDDSLQMVHAGNTSAAHHYRFVMTDPRVAPDSRKWMAWCNATGGNILHACARWNDVEIAQDLLRNQIDGLTDAVDGDGCTPYETAQQCGHESICQVLEAFGADTSNYVYDIFCLQQDADIHATKVTNGNTKGGKDGRPASSSGKHDEVERGADFSEEIKEEEPVSLELRGGVGYWTEDGELILEATTKETLNTDEYQDDIDSNCEDYGGNDYPDEDEFWEEEFLYGNAGTLDQYHEYHGYGEEIDDYAAAPEYLYE